MSPEQATPGQRIGPVSDIYALGCVLYEMLAGEPPFTGATAQAALAKIRTEAPRPLAGYRSMIPPNVDAVVRRALEKVPADRFRSGGEFAEALANPDFRHGPLGVPAARIWRPMAVAGWSVAAILLLVTLWLTASISGRNPPSVVRSSPLFIDREFAISPDGSVIVFGDGEGPLWRHVLGEEEPVPISGTTGGQEPSFSPDGSEIAFHAGGFIKSVPVVGGPPTILVEPPDPPMDRELTNSDLPWQPSWGEDGMVYYVQRERVHRVSESGSDRPEPVLPSHQGGQWFPSPLPGGRGLLFTVKEPDDYRIGRSDSWVAVVGPDETEPRKLVKGNSARYASSGHLLYVTWDGTLMGVPFALESLDTTGPPTPLEEGEPGREAIEVDDWGNPTLAISQTGTLLYRTGGVTQTQRALYWDGVDGRRTVDSTWIANFRGISISPDHTRYAVIVNHEFKQEIWVSTFDGERELIYESNERLRGLAWSPDGEYISFVMDRGPRDDVGVARADALILRADGTDSGSADSLLHMDPEIEVDPPQWSPDGHWMLFVLDPDDDRDPPSLWAKRYGVDAGPVEWAEHGGLMFTHPFSPDGQYVVLVVCDRPHRSVAYSSGGFDVHEVMVGDLWVRPFPDPGRDIWQYGSGAIVWAQWSHDGTRIFFRDLKGVIRQVEVETEPVFSWGQVSVVFDAGAYRREIDVGLDDKSFLLATDHWLDQAAGEKKYLMIQNYFAKLSERMVQ
jgi:hypothetical protein